MKIRIAALALLAASVYGCGPGAIERQRQDLDGVYRAGKAIEGAIQVGVTYQQLGELVGRLASEVSIAKERAKPGEESVITAFTAALETYQDSYKIWGDSLSEPPFEARMEIYRARERAGRILTGFEEKEILLAMKYRPASRALLAKYGIPTPDSAVLDIAHVQAVWQIAGERLGKANALLYPPGPAQR